MKNKKGFTLIELIGVVTLLSLIALVVYPSVTTVIRNSKEKTYKDQIELIIKAAKQWGVEHAEELPDDGGTVTLSMDKLLNGGYLTNDDIIDPRNTDQKINGVVIISYASNQYVYEYTNETFKSAIAAYLKEENSDISGDVFKGSSPNNYIKFDGELWRIIKINNDETVKIIKNSPLDKKAAWDTNGNGYWDQSSLNKYLNLVYYNELKDVKYLTKATWYTGTIGDTITETNIENYVGLINANEYIEASGSENCNVTSIINCAEANYLNISGISYYTLTHGGSAGYNYVYMIKNGILTNDYSEYQAINKTELFIKPVVTLKQSVKIVGGSGSESDPYNIAL